ncbi:MAG: TlyA family RNA methyltransferase [Candidatus Margulisiibacteriota bacterium]
MKIRLDQLLVEKGFFESRTRAQSAIMAGQILVDEQKIDKAGTLINEDSKIRILGEKLKYVSRGGLKLEKALDEFGIDPINQICLDIGASTGGFTDCLLQRGAEKVYAIDVGYGQLDLKIRNDPKVVVIERTNARYLRPQDIPDKASLAVIDVSFISLSKILPAVFDLLAGDGQVAALVKPQFEAGRDKVGKGGIVKDEQARKDVLAKVIKEAESIGFKFIASCDSPISGADGNKEFLIHLKKM